MTRTITSRTAASDMPALAFYGDDFTGATDTLATIARAGLRAMLFLRPPTEAQRLRAGPLDCLGIAGAARSMDATAQEKELSQIAAYFAALGSPITHYKTCSTFDSSPQTGSIGLAARILREAIGNPRFLPVVGGQPNLGRYCVFGNLFAAYRTGGPAYRLDRHPTMSRHPVTPMQESDLTAHLASQGMVAMSCIQYPQYALPPNSLDAAINEAIKEGPDGVLFDVATSSQLAIIGRVMWQHAGRERLLAIGPSSVATALIEAWPGGLDESRPHDDGHATRPESAVQGPVLVFSGSMSPVTASQIGAAGSYAKVSVPAQALLLQDPALRDASRRQIVSLLQAGHHVLACVEGSCAAQPGSLAAACGQFLAGVLSQRRPGRLGIAGGDTSSHAVQALDVWGLSYVGQIDHGAALCKLHAQSPQLDGLEIMLKGGQMGAIDIFERLLH